MSLWNGCQLATRYERTLFTGSDWAAEPKFDGLRCVTIIDGSGVHPFSRGENEWQGIKPLLAPIAWAQGFVVDGELLHEDGWGATSGAVHRTNLTSDILAKISYHVFDILPIADYKAGRCQTPLNRRRAILERLVKESGDKSPLLLSPQTPLASMEEAEKVAKTFVEQGYEGAIFKHVYSPYICNRTASWLKFKNEVTEDATITGSYEGTGQFVGALGGFFVEFPDGRKCKVGGGYSVAQRKRFWTDREKMVGKIIEVKYQDDTKKVAEVRMPRFFRLRTDKAKV